MYPSSHIVELRVISLTQVLDKTERGEPLPDRASPFFLYRQGAQARGWVGGEAGSLVRPIKNYWGILGSMLVLNGSKPTPLPGFLWSTGILGYVQPGEMRNSATWTTNESKITDQVAHIWAKGHYLGTLEVKVPINLLSA